MNVQTLLLDSLNTRWDKYKAGLKTCQQEFSEGAVHDLRVAVRRLLSYLDLLRTVMQNPGIQKMKLTLKDQLNDLDDLRNIQALLADLSKITRERLMLQPFQEYLQLKEKKLLRAARKGIQSLEIDVLAKRIRKLEQRIEALEQTNLDTSLFAAVDESYAIVNQRYMVVDPDQPVTIHRVRLAFKKFRYMIEVIYPTLQNVPVDYLKRMHDYQTMMGDIQDMEVALQELTGFSELAPASYDPEPARTYYMERHALALSRYIENKGQIIAFWRATPDQPFSEEK
jgi:CHAD domain-containing protein